MMRKCFRNIVGMNSITAESEVNMVGNDFSASRSEIVGIIVKCTVT